MRILLIEDNAAQASGIKPVLRSEGFDFNSSEIDKEGVELGKRCDYDVIILDRSLSDMNGLNVLKALRAAKVHAPVLVLSGDASTRAMVSSLDAGADDYITKPYHKAELVARICAVARRSRVHPQSLIAEGKIILNLDGKTVEVAGSKVHLTIKEYEVLECLLLKKGVTLTKRSLLNYLYGDMETRPEKLIDVFICKLRKKLAGVMDGDDYIRTVWGLGYAFCGPALSRRQLPRRQMRAGTSSMLDGPASSAPDRKLSGYGLSTQ